MRTDRRGFLLPPVLLIVLWLSAWAAIALGRASAAVHRSVLALGAVDGQRGLLRGLEVVTTPPDLSGLCESAPLGGWRQRWGMDGGGAVEVRWRHLGAALILAEIDASDPLGGRRRALVWLTPDSVAQALGPEVRCWGSALHVVAGGAAFTRPGE